MLSFSEGHPSLTVELIFLVSESIFLISSVRNGTGQVFFLIVVAFRFVDISNYDLFAQMFDLCHVVDLLFIQFMERFIFKKSFF